jgi:hypothetical protein
LCDGNFTDFATANAAISFSALACARVLPVVRHGRLFSFGTELLGVDDCFECIKLFRVQVNGPDENTPKA